MHSPEPIYLIWPHDGGPPVLWLEPCPFPVEDGEVVAYIRKDTKAMSHDDGEKKGLQYSSTDDQRTDVGKGTRQQYRKLTTEEQVQMAGIKETGQNMIDLFTELSDKTPTSAREYNIAIERMEDAIMWAVKGLTK